MPGYSHMTYLTLCNSDISWEQEVGSKWPEYRPISLKLYTLEQSLSLLAVISHCQH